MSSSSNRPCAPLDHPSNPGDSCLYLSTDPALLRPLRREDVKDVLVSRAGLTLDAALVRSARGRSCLDLCLGERLFALQQHQGFLTLGFSRANDYAREMLGLGARSTEALLRLGRELAGFPALRQAVEQGEVTARKAEIVLGVVTEASEARWIEQARRHTVRRLLEQVRAERAALRSAGAGEGRDCRGAAGVGEGTAAGEAGLDPTAEPSPDVRVELPVSAEAAAGWARALELARRVVGVGAPVGELVEAVCGEYLGHAIPQLQPGELAGLQQALEDDDVAAEETERRAAAAALRQELGEVLERKTGDWGELPQLGREIARPDWARTLPTGAHELHDQLLRLVGLRQRLDADLGRLGRLFSQIGAWRLAGFASLEHYATERLGLAPRTFAQHVRQDGWLQRHPALEERYRDGRLSSEQLRLLARLRVPDRLLLDWADHAAQVTCRRLEQEVVRAEATLRQEPDAELSAPQLRMCAELAADVAGAASSSATAPALRGAGAVRFRSPRSVRSLLLATLQAARWLLGPTRPPGRDWSVEVAEVAGHFVRVHGQPEAPTAPLTLPQQVARRDRWRCTVPGCTSRLALHAHHVIPRGRGGADELTNLTLVCRDHHLGGIHQGRLAVSGLAPHDLRWQLGLAPDREPVACWAGDEGVLAVGTDRRTLRTG